MVLTTRKKTVHIKSLSDLEEIELLKTLSLLRTIIDLFPESAEHRQHKINEWVKLDDWAILAVTAVRSLLRNLSPVQSRSVEAEQAFNASLSVYDLIADIVEQRFSSRDPADFGAAKAALETCFSTVYRLVEPKTDDDGKDQSATTSRPLS